MREKLLNAFADGAEFTAQALYNDADYPWLTHLSSRGLLEEPLAAHPETKCAITIHWLHTCEGAIDVIYHAVNSGKCICWIRNTIDSASDVFQQLRHDGKIPEHDLLLFHSRFAYTDRITIEEKTLKWFGKNASVNERRGKVLIATQVVEQSLDLDFDCMISDLAPIDLLIQRAGRLQRHSRDAQGNYKTTLPDERQPPILHILAPSWQPHAKQDWLGQELRSTGYVYPDHACLWRTQALLREAGEIRLPDNIRKLVNGVYEQKIDAPCELQEIAKKVFDQVLSQCSVAAQSLLQRDIGYKQKAGLEWDGVKAFSTRLSLSEESLDIYLAWLDENNNLHPVVTDGDFPWEMSRLSVRVSWWQKHATNFLCPNDHTVEQLRKKLHRPGIQVVLVSQQGEAPYYSKRFGLTIKTRDEIKEPSIH